MSSTAEPTQERPALDELLVAIDREPVELIEAIRSERERAMDEPALTRDLDRAELAFLKERAAAQRYGDALDRLVDAANRAGMGSARRTIAVSSPGHPAILFDLAELCAAYRFEGLDAEVVAVRAMIAERLAVVGEITERMREEAHERYAALSTQAEDLELQHKVWLLEETGTVFDGLVERTGDKELRRLAKRLGRQACDLVLTMRLESILTRRGAGWLENTSLILLVLVLVLLVIESAFELPAGAIRALLFADAFICLFFIGEFLFKLALAPARSSWFLRNALTDLVPAVPAALWLLPAGPDSGNLVLVRMLRLFRITQFARYVQALRPILRFYRLLLFLVRSMDSLVERFSHLLNRNFVFFERAVLPLPTERALDLRARLFQAQRREHVLLADLPVGEARPLLEQRAERLALRFGHAEPVPLGSDSPRKRLARDVPVEHAIEFLHRLRSEELGMWLPRNDILAVDRLVHVINAPLIRSLPFVRWFRSPTYKETPDDRVVDLGRRIANVFERWRERVLHVADMHGIVTGPQILDRVATALVKASQRPAVRLLLFGGLFWLVQLSLGGQSWLGHALERFVALPLVILGGVCLVFLTLGRWLKSIAGEASDTFKLTSEANFIGLLELHKRRHQDEDLEFLGKRVFRWDMDQWEAAGQLGHSLQSARTGRVADGVVVPPGLEDEIHRVALLYLHFLDGAVLHENDIKTTEQLIANLSLQNIRNSHFGFSRRDRRRLKKLSLAEGSLFRGPYVWFRFITESVAVEAAKRVTDYNRHCLTLSQRGVAEPEDRVAFARWLRKRRTMAASRGERMDAPVERNGRSRIYRTTEFNALDFLSVDSQREQHVERVFGPHVLGLLREDRERMIREIFGTRPLHELPASRRTLNFYAFYSSRLSGGRVLLAPYYAFRMFLRVSFLGCSKVSRIVREILAPELAAQSRERGRAPFAVALRKIHRMKAPTLLEAMRLRAAFDPSYCGAPPGWSLHHGFEQTSELDRDLGFLMMRARDREPICEVAERNRRRVEELHHLFRRLPNFVPHEPDPGQRRAGERAVTIAYMTDRDEVRTLFRAAQWLDAALVRFESPDTRLPARRLHRFVTWIARGLRVHPVDRWLRTRVADRNVSRRGRSNFKRAWHAGDLELRDTVRAWLALPAGASLHDVAIARVGVIYRTRDDISRELAALRAVQSLSVLDVRNYRKMVFDLGGYARDGEDPTLAEALP